MLEFLTMPWKISNKASNKDSNKNGNKNGNKNSNKNKDNFLFRGRFSIQR